MNHQAMLDAGWTLHSNDDGLREYRGPHDMSAFIPAHNQYIIYYRAYWEKIYGYRALSPLEAAWDCIDNGVVLQPKPKGYKHGLPSQVRIGQ